VTTKDTAMYCRVRITVIWSQCESRHNLPEGKRYLSCRRLSRLTSAWVLV
jgi:hypothetical protein